MHRGPFRFPLGLLVLGAAVAAALACAKADSDVIQPVRQGPIRLFDELARAEIESPLQGLPPWEAVSSALAEEVVWERPAAPAPGSTGCVVADGGEIRCGLEERAFNLIFRIPLEAYSQYRIGMRVRSAARFCANLRLRDRRGVRVARFQEKRDEWESLSEPWSTGGNADTLVISIRGRCPVSIDSLALHRAVMGRDEELSLLASQARSAFSGVDLGIAKYGPLLPREQPNSVEPPFDESFGFRETLFAPAPTRLTYRLRVPSQARLRFSYAMAEASRVGDRARFEVLVQQGREAAQTIWSQELVVDPERWHWHEAVIDLSPWSSQVVDLTLQTRTAGERGYALWGTPTIEKPRRANDPPNVIIIAVDTLRADRLSAYGYPKPLSPNLDAFARDGVLFLDAISQSTQTPPSFNSLFTGLIVPRHGMLFADSRLAPTVPTLARIFRQNGWTTHAIMYQAAMYDADSMARGFERYFNVPRTHHRADQNLGKAVAWLDDNGDRRFFLFLHFLDPHQPFTQPEAFVQPATAEALEAYEAEIPFNVRGSIGNCKPCKSEEGVPESFRPVVKELYDEEVAYVDDQIGLFLDALADRGLYRDTVIAFVSDHGETLWDHHDFFDHGGVNQHDELTRVPLIIKPDEARDFASNRVVSTQVRLFDLMPTLLDLTGIDTSVLNIDAQSLMPFLRADSPGEREDRWAFSSNEQSASVRGRGWKYIHALSLGEELYDLDGDPAETRNVIDLFPDVLRTMRARYMEILIESLGGRFLLVLGDGQTPQYQVRMAGIEERPGPNAERRMAFLGLQPKPPEEPGVRTFAGKAPRGNLVLFRQLPGAEQPSITVDGETLEIEELPYRPGLPERLLASSPPGAYLLSAPRKADAAADADTADLDTEQEEALRALGYIE